MQGRIVGASSGFPPPRLSLAFTPVWASTDARGDIMPIKRQPKRPGPPLPGLRLSDLRERSCRWPLGAFTDPPLRFCGDTTAGTSPYCSDHTKRAFSGVKSRPPPLPHRV